jgi:hypothetical protein
MLVETTVNYVLKTTGAHSSAQNGLAEKPNQDLARMMRSMLYGAGLGSQYWAYAIRHAVYLKNRLPHTSLQYVTPYEKLNGVKPDLSRARIFGSRVHFMHNERAKKLDKMDRFGKSDPFLEVCVCFSLCRLQHRMTTFEISIRMLPGLRIFVSAASVRIAVALVVIITAWHS